MFIEAENTALKQFKIADANTSDREMDFGQQSHKKLFDPNSRIFADEPEQAISRFTKNLNRKLRQGHF